MKKSIVKGVSILLSTLFIVNVFTACSKKNDANGTEKEKTAAQTKNEGGITFPLEKPIKLRYWVPMSSGSATMKNFSEHEMYKELEKRTGIKIEFIHPPEGQGKEQLNLMIASKDLPDIIEDGIKHYPGKYLKAYEDGIIVDIKDLQKQYAPNLTKLYTTYPELLMDIETESGNVFFTPFIRGNTAGRIFYGLYMRSDWLKELNMNPPTTMDEIYQALKAFKEKKGAKSPFTGAGGKSGSSDRIRNDAFLGAYGLGPEFFAEKGKVLYGPYDPRFKDYVATMAKWYKEGLIDSEFASITGKNIDAKMTNGEAGASYGLLGGHFGTYLQLMKEKDAKYDLVGLQPPSLKPGEPSLFMKQDPIVSELNATVITTANKYPKETMALLDYGYGKEGHMLFNFGTEGVSYKMENGYPKFTDLITNNSDGTPMASILVKYTRSKSNGPFVTDGRYGEQLSQFPQQKQALQSWTKWSKEATEANTRVYENLTTEENARIAPLMTEINTYRDEMFLKWVMGQQPLDNFEQYRQQLQKMGMDEVLKIRQAAYDRFVKKFPQALKQRNIEVEQFYTK